MIIEKNNNDIPDYLDGEFFKNALINGLGCENIEIKALNFSMGSSGGENYLSFIYRAQITYVQNSKDSKTISLIIKSIPMDGAREAFAEMDIFRKEKEMYLSIIPRIEDCLQGVAISPRCFYAQSEPIATIAFEDMKSSGFDLADRVKGLNEAHCKMVLTKLAQYHAGGMILLAKDPSLLENDLLKRGIFSSAFFALPMMQEPIKVNFNKLIECAYKWPDCEKIAAKIEKYGFPKMLENFSNSARIVPDDIITICHGDMWTNNFLYKYGTDRSCPIDVTLIDFQGSMVGSIGLDLNYILNTSLEITVFAAKKHELVETCYYPALKAALEKGGFKGIPTLQEVQLEIKRKAIYGLMSALITLPVTSMSKVDSADNSIEGFQNENEQKRVRDVSFSAPRFVGTMSRLLKEYDMIGLFD